ncbi:MAG: Eco57I restriction-modification methylase domain-containing protein [Thermoanaerobaculia bacterium]
MIGASELASCRDLDGVVRLFRALGYPVEPVDLEPAVWVETVDGEPVPDLVHLCRTAGLDLFAATGRDIAGWAERFVEKHGRLNATLKPVLAVHGTNGEPIALHSRNARGRTRRLEIDLQAPCPDALERLNALRFDGERDIRGIVERVFDRESVGRGFFLRFRASVARMRDDLATARGAAVVDCSAASLLVHARLLFLYFIQQKGWLNDEPRYLATRFDGCGDDIWRSLLAPLFFECLNTPRSERPPRARHLGRIPYLNGGLFERTAFERRHAPLPVSDATLRGAVEDVFERYSFSIDEADGDGVHIDPEMLGRVFESLMEEGERAASGSFYTPRQIVEVLTRRAIVSWCAAGDARLESALDAMAGGHPASLSRSDAATLLERLEKITVLDPACGSGAFLLAALHLIERLIGGLSEIACAVVATDLRRRIVERSLYGVDLKQEAVHLCELRLWLAIVAGSRHSIDEVPPLPNLDRNILQGNSLLAPVDFLSDGPRGLYAAWRRSIHGMAELLERYRHAPRDEKPQLYRTLRALDGKLAASLLRQSLENDTTELRRLEEPRRNLFGNRIPRDRDGIRAIEERIARTRAVQARLRRGTFDFFAYEVHFAHNVSAGGFDVILGNPPWVRGARIDARERRMLADRYPLFASRGAGRAGFEQSDLSVAFAERALTLLAPGGVTSLLLPSKIANAGYAGALRAEVARKREIVAIDDWSTSGKALFDADTFPLGLTIRRSAPRDSIRVTTEAGSYSVSQREIGAQTVWTLDPPEVSALFARLRSSFPPLREALRRSPVMGVKSGANALFFRDDVIVDGSSVRLERMDLEVPSSAVCRAIRGRDVRRWRAEASTWMIWPPPRSQPAAWADAYASRMGIARDSFALAYARPEHLGIKVVWKDVSRGMQAAVAPSATRVGGIEFALVPNQTVYAIDAASIEEARVVAALLNSSIFGALAVSIAERAKDHHHRYFAATVAEVALPRIKERSAAWRDLARLARRGETGHAVEGDIDALVASLYGLSPREAEKMRRYLDMRLGR